MMRDDFCVFILSHGRPDRVYTDGLLVRSGYTGKSYIVIDDEDKTAGQYRERFKDRLLCFSKEEVAEWIDVGDNISSRKGVIYARNVCWQLARQVGCRYFIVLDDDYTGFYYRFDGSANFGNWLIRKTIDGMFSCLIDMLERSDSLSVCISQGGDWIGGGEGKSISLKRKAMNTFVCSVDRPFQFFGRINEDTTTYVTTGRVGGLFFTVNQAQVNQVETQSHSGGMTDLYLDHGTYVKSFYSIMYAPSCVKVGVLGDPRGPHFRVHHKINWNNTVPRILRETHRKQRLCQD